MTVRRTDVSGAPPAQSGLRRSPRCAGRCRPEVGVPVPARRLCSIGIAPSARLRRAVPTGGRRSRASGSCFPTGVRAETGVIPELGDTRFRCALRSGADRRSAFPCRRVIYPLGSCRNQGPSSGTTEHCPNGIRLRSASGCGPGWGVSVPWGEFPDPPSSGGGPLAPRGLGTGRLVWHVLDGPGWNPHFADATEALPRVVAAAQTWSGIATADIRWRVDGIVDGQGDAMDGRNVVVALPADIEDDIGSAGYARHWYGWNPGRQRWEQEECDVVLGPPLVELMKDTEDPNSLYGLRHEFGHCLGLEHATRTPTVLSGTPSSVWYEGPVMSFLWTVQDDLTEDDAVGVSLLRPARGWVRTTGSISGKVILDGQPARFVSVVVLRNEGGRARPSLQVFTDEAGIGEDRTTAASTAMTMSAGRGGKHPSSPSSRCTSSNGGWSPPRAEHRTCSTSSGTTPPRSVSGSALPTERAGDNRPSPVRRLDANWTSSRVRAYNGVPPT